MEVDDDEDAPPILREESDNDVKINMDDLPSAEESARRGTAEDAIHVEDDENEDIMALAEEGTASQLHGSDEKKKMGLSTAYDGFQIYGRILCLVVKRKDRKGQQLAGRGGQAMVEEWISSTQANENVSRDS